jgi:Family of unknown function (DUF5519)/Metallo-beta-lactamase superfamily
MTQLRTFSSQIIEEAGSWPGVEIGPGRRGELALKVGRKEIGHLHGDHAAHFGFPRDVWTRLIEDGRIVPHPVFPDRAGPAARRIESEEDVRDVIALLRLNYDRVTARAFHDTPLRGLRASAPETMPFAPSLGIRAFVLGRERGDILMYSVTGLRGLRVARHYLNHWHEGMFASEGVDAPLFVHEADRAKTQEHYAVRAAFSRRHTLDEDLEVIPTPGHTPGATAYLWDNGEHRILFSGDTIYLDEGEWVAAVLESSDRARYVESLELLREVDFTVLVPWAATLGERFHAPTDREDARRRIDAIIERVRGGAHH